MSDKSAIEWTQASWNTTTGCTKVSEGCDHCYIERTPPFRMEGRKFEGPGGPTAPGATTGVRLHPERLDWPLRWRKPRLIFVDSLSDLFHADVPDEFIADVFAVMGLASRHTFQVLTKRPGRMASLLRKPAFGGAMLGIADAYQGAGWPPGGFADFGWPLRNVWLGTSVETQKWADVRIPKLLETPAAVRFLSCEPLLGPIDLSQYLYPNDEGIEVDPGFPRWVIVGGESGPGARPMHPAWARSLQEQCVAAGVPFFFKQWGGRTPKSGGRLLDGRTWEEFPDGRR